ncbi:MAG TPA: VOC family protein [Verrucomicrobiae bacterium]|nr:VOC family protein [Verrucomicrobiae bacterium]
MSTETNFRKIQRVEPVIRADELGFVVFERRDAQSMARFFEDFGMVRLEDAPGPSLYFRGYGRAPYCVEIIPSNEDSFVGSGFFARNEADLERLAETAGIPVESVTAPGGGRRVRLRDPEGWQVDVVCGFRPAAPLQNERAERTPENTPLKKLRVDKEVRIPIRPTPVHRLGHVVLFAPNFEVTSCWYMKWLGMLPTDVLTDAEGYPRGAFFRLNRGEKPSDHHNVAIFAAASRGVHHVSTETLDVDDIGQGQQYLKAKGWKHFWGIGRHLLGSQIFDYWLDPVGLEWEHYADGDVMTEKYTEGYHLISRRDLWAWGDDLPSATKPSPGAIENAPSYLKGLLVEWDKPPRPWLT